MRVQESQICHMLCVTANLDKEKEEGSMIYDIHIH
jgi:hypothetical protein